MLDHGGSGDLGVLPTRAPGRLRKLNSPNRMNLPKRGHVIRPVFVAARFATRVVPGIIEREAVDLHAKWRGEIMLRVWHPLAYPPSP